MVRRYMTTVNDECSKEVCLMVETMATAAGTRGNHMSKSPINTDGLR